MAVYTLHKSSDDLRCVREGFNFWAFLLGFFWALFKGYWLIAAVMLGLSILLSGAFHILGLDLFGQAVVNIAFQVLFGLYANDLARWTLARRGFVEEAVVRAETRDHALAQYGAMH